MANQDALNVQVDPIEGSCGWQIKGRYQVYQPSPDEIHRQCLIFQKTWTKQERRRRNARDGSEEPKRLFVEIRVIHTPTALESVYYE